MDNLTHTLFAATLARTRLGRVGRGATAALIISANAPDIDIVAAAGGTGSYLTWHRGTTHGLLGIVGLGLITAAAVRAVVRRGEADEASPAATFTALAGLSMLGVLTHIVMDVFTPYGTRLLSPFDWHWYSFDSVPIIDPYILAALAACLYFGFDSPQARRLNAALVLLLIVGDFGVRTAAHERAMALVPRLFGPTLPQACDSQANPPFISRWPPPALSPSADGRRCLVDVAAVPDIVSAFRWRVIVRASNSYEVLNVDILSPELTAPPVNGEAFWRRAQRYPFQWTPVIRESAAADEARRFLGFSRFPFARASADSANTIVQWTDMRFAGALVPNQPPPGLGIQIRMGPDGRAIPGRASP